MFLTRVSIILTALYLASGKIYKRCELARELRNFDMPEDEIPTWVCIVQHESNYNTTAMNPGSGDHGLFQISQLYWCSPPGDGYGCNSPCSKFRDDDIADDLQCIRRIHNEHKRISGNGFDAWVVYPQHCKGDNSRYIHDCFDDESDIKPNNVTDNEISTEDVDEYGDGYQFPALPSVTKKHKEENIDFGDGYEFPKLPYSKASIHHSLPVKTSTERQIFKSLFHDSVPVRENINQLSKFPFSKTSIHYSTPAKDTNNNYNFPKFPSSKESIHYFIPVSKEKENILLGKQVIKEEYTSAHTSEKTTVKKTNNETKSAVSMSKSSTSHSAYKSTTQPTTEYTPTTEYVTTNKPLTTPDRSIIFSRKQYDFSSNLFLKTATDIPLTSTIATTTITTYSTNFKTPLKSSTKKPLTTAKKPLKIFTSSSKPLLTSLMSTSKPKNRVSVTERSEFADLEGASSTIVPSGVIYRPSTTTLKPLATFKPITLSTTTSFISERLGNDQTKTLTTGLGAVQRQFSSFTFKPFTTTATLHPNVISTKKTHINQPFTTIKPPTSYSYRPFSTTNTTLKPSSGRQVTFAPDSFFSWLFGSQTLPPLISPMGPNRPPRPPGDRPGGSLLRPTTIRPTLNERPGGLPRPPGVLPGGTPNVPPVPTRRPFPMRPNMMSRPMRLQQIPFASSQTSEHPPRRPHSPKDHFAYPSQTGDRTKTAAQTSRMLDPDEEEGVRIKLDDNFVFVRTKYGYRLFRT